MTGHTEKVERRLEESDFNLLLLIALVLTSLLVSGTARQILTVTAATMYIRYVKITSDDKNRLIQTRLLYTSVLAGTAFVCTKVFSVDPLSTVLGLFIGLILIASTVVDIGLQEKYLGM